MASVTDKTAYNLLVDDDGSGNTGSVWSKASVNAIYQAVDGVFANASGIVMAGPVTERGLSVPMGVWQSYTPTWSGGSTPPTLGNATLTGRYTLVGNTVHYRISLTIGTTTTPAIGIWTFTLPFIPNFSGRSTIGTAHLGNVGAVDYSGTVFSEAPANTLIIGVSGGTTYVNDTTPFTFDDGDFLTLSGSYKGVTGDDMDRHTEQTYILTAIDSLRNELLARDDARKESIDGILAHLETLNGKTAKSADAITRLNLVVFGIGGPVCLAGIGAVFKFWLG